MTVPEESLVKVRLTSAHVVALVALLVALLVSVLVSVAGTGLAGYAAGRSSGNALIKKSSLSGNRLKADTVKGAQIDESTLGLVPRAAAADAVPAPSFQALKLEPNWAPIGSGLVVPVAGFRKDVSGFVHLQGAVTRTAAVTNVIGRLPAGARPNDFRYFVVYTAGGNLGTIFIGANGDITLNSGEAAFVSLESISFYPDA